LSTWMRRASTPVSHVGDHGAERVSVEGIAVQRLGMEHELSALWRRHGVAILTLQPNS
jgi:hypothetical protein